MALPSGGAFFCVTVAYASKDGTAKAGEDYVAVSGTLTFAPGETSQTINVPVIGDTIVESDEQFLIVLSNAVGGSLDGGTATVTILNDDLSFTAASYEYANVGGTSLTLDVMTPLTVAGLGNGSSSGSGNAPLPVIIWVPGSTIYAPGGDVTAVRETMRGYVVVNVNYRPAGQAVFPAQLDDIKAAVRWLRANAARLNIDAQHIGIWGSGAGAHLAALAGTTGDSVSPDGIKEGNPSFPQRVQAVVDWAGPADLLHLQSDAATGCASNANASTSPQSILIGCPLQSCPAAANAASPLSFISADDAPVLIMHGASDYVVPPEQSRRFFAALRSAGVDAKLHIIDGVGAFDPWWSTDAAYAEVDAFLDAHLKGAPSRRRGAGH